MIKSKICVIIKTQFKIMKTILVSKNPCPLSYEVKEKLKEVPENMKERFIKIIILSKYDN